METLTRDLPVLDPQSEPAFSGEGLSKVSSGEAGLHWRRLWTARKFLGRAALWGFCFALIVAFLLPKRYESTTQIMPPDLDSSGMGMGMMSAAMGAKAGGTAGSVGASALSLLGLQQGGTFVPILSSRTVQDRILDRFDLMHVYGNRYRVDARKKLKNRTDIVEDHKTGVITLTVTDGDPQRAAAIARAYVDELDRLSAELSTSAAHRERVFIENRLKTVDLDLDHAEKEFSEFASKNTAIDIQEQGKAMVEAAAVLQGELIAAQSELEGLGQIYTENNVRIRTLRARVAELKKQLEKLGGTDASLAGNGQSSEIYPSIRKLPLLGVQYANLYRETKIQETVYELLTEQYEMAKIEEAKEIPTVKVLDAALVPEKKSFPPRLLMGVLGMLFSVVLGYSWLIAKQKWVEADPLDSRKVLAQEVFTALKSDWKRFWKRRSQLPGDVTAGTSSWRSSAEGGDEGHG